MISQRVCVCFSSPIRVHQVCGPAALFLISEGSPGVSKSRSEPARDFLPQRVVATRGRDARSQRVVATRGRKARPQRAVAARGPNARSQRVVATRGRNAWSQRAAATRGRNANQGRQKACFTGSPQRNAQPGPTEGLFYRTPQAKRPTWAGRRPVLQEAPSETPNLGRQKACFTRSPKRNAQPGPTEGLFYRKLQAKRPTWAGRRPVSQEAPSETSSFHRFAAPGDGATRRGFFGWV